MALDTLSGLMILVCVVALIILLSLIAYTWVKWHNKEVQLLMNPPNEPVPPATEITEQRPYPPQTHFQQGFLNEVGKDSPNLSGSRTFLNDDVLRQRPFPTNGNVPEFKSNDVVYHADAERNPDKLLAGDVVFHAKGPFANDNKTTDAAVDVGHVAFNVEDTNGQRRRTESHSKNTYL